MMQTVTITPKWQIYLPQQIRQALDWVKPGKAVVEVEGERIVIAQKRKQSPLMSLAGKYKHLYKKKPININKVRDYVDYSKI